MRTFDSDTDDYGVECRVDNSTMRPRVFSALLGFTQVCVNRLTGLVVKAPASQMEDPEFYSRLRRGDFSRWSHASDFGTPVESFSNFGTPVATLPSAWRYRVSAGTGPLGVSIL